MREDQERYQAAPSRPEPLPGTDWYEEGDLRFLLKGMSQDTFRRFAQDVGLEAYHATATFRWYSIADVVSKMEKRPVLQTSAVSNREVAR